MSRETVIALFGERVVDNALAEPNPAPLSPELLRALRRAVESLGPGALRSWALAQPWPEFAAVIAVLSGAVREVVERAGDR